MNINLLINMQEKHKITQEIYRQCVSAVCIFCAAGARPFLAELTYCASTVSGDVTALPVRSEYGDCAQPFS